MLHSEIDRRYLVYPTWCEFRIPFQGMLAALRDPFTGCGVRDTKDSYLSLGYPDVIPEMRSISGLPGGGVIVVETPPKRWMTISLFGDVFQPHPVNHRRPQGLTLGRNDYHFDVHWFEPEDQLGANFGCGTKAKTYRCCCTPEQLSSAADRVYWVFEYKKGKQKLRQFDEVLPSLAAPFCRQFSLIGETPEHLQEETSTWFGHPEREQIWFEVVPFEFGMGYNYAAVLYAVLELRALIGPRLVSGHVATQLEQPLNFRHTWPKVPFTRN